MLRQRMLLLLSLFSILRFIRSQSIIPVGTEFTLRPLSSGVCDILRFSEGPWLDSHSNPVATDPNGNPTNDAYIILFIEAPVPLDPNHFLPSSIYGQYLITFDGKVNDMIVGPTVNATITNTQFNTLNYSTTAIFTLYPSSSVDPTTGIAIGFFGTTRNSSAPLNSGITNIHVYSPSCWTKPTSSSSSLSLTSYQILSQWFHPSLLHALLPFSQIRCMEYMMTNYNYTYMNGNELQWSNRSLMSDTLWTIPNYVRSGSVSPPWETVIILYQELIQYKQRTASNTSSPLIPPSLWLNIPIAASDDYVNNWIQLLINGNEFTNRTGLPFSSSPYPFHLYIEYGNEVWLNGTEGGPGTNYLYNLDASIDEVNRGHSNLNNDGNTNPQVWGQRRHLRRLYEISQSIQDNFPSLPNVLTSTIRLLYGTFQSYGNDVYDTFTWFTSTYPTVPLSSFLYGVCINSYLISYFPAGTTIEEMYTNWLMNSDDQVTDRISMRNVLTRFNLPGLVSYEGSPVGIAANNDDQTNSWIIAANRYSPIGDVIAYDILNNWYHNTEINGTAYNIYALSSKYAPPPIFQWGIVEDLANLTTAKYTMVENLVREN